MHVWFWHYVIRTRHAVYFIRHHGDSGHTYVTRHGVVPVIGDNEPCTNRLATWVNAKVGDSMTIRFADGEVYTTSLVESTLSRQFDMSKPYLSVNNDRQVALGI